MMRLVWLCCAFGKKCSDGVPTTRMRVFRAESSQKVRGFSGKIRLAEIFVEYSAACRMLAEMSSHNLALVLQRHRRKYGFLTIGEPAVTALTLSLATRCLKA